MPHPSLDMTRGAEKAYRKEITSVLFNLNLLGVQNFFGILLTVFSRTCLGKCYFNLIFLTLF